MTRTLESTIPMLTLRFDDGYSDLITGFKPILDSFNVVGVVCVLAALIGVIGYLTWEQLKEFYNWEIVVHGLTDVDISTLSSKEAENHIVAARNILQKEDYPCRNFVPHRSAAWHSSIREMGAKYFDSVHCGGVSPVLGINPKVFNAYNMFAICGDANPNWLAKNEFGIRELKEKLDTVCSENRWLIYYLHTYSDDKGKCLKEIIDYALKKDIRIVTIEQGLKLCK